MECSRGHPLLTPAATATISAPAHGQGAPLAGPQLGSCARLIISRPGLAWWLWAACTDSRGGRRVARKPRRAPSHCLHGSPGAARASLELAASV
eukprot:scaffold7429_cov66-Phaeocystis_antarctica.AAC.1